MVEWKATICSGDRNRDLNTHCPEPTRKHSARESNDTDDDGFDTEDSDDEDDAGWLWYVMQDDNDNYNCDNDHAADENQHENDDDYAHDANESNINETMVLIGLVMTTISLQQ